MNKDNLTVIIGIWKRDSTEEIINLIESQTISDNISDIIIWQNDNHIDISDLVKKYNFAHIHSVNKNWKFHARFTLPLLVNTKYCIVLDDDTLIGPKYLEECIRFSQAHDDKVIICSNGRDINNPSQPNNQAWYESSDTKSPIEVDFGGHSWFFKTDIIHYMWKDHSRNFDSGEDIELCASAQVFGNIKTFVLGTEDRDAMGDMDRLKYGIVNASSGADLDAHYAARGKMISYWINKGWKLKCTRNHLTDSQPDADLSGCGHDYI
jgi:hypothetical protein